jgi:chloramphenicol-sensitive protein RarD
MTLPDRSGTRLGPSIRLGLAMAASCYGFWGLVTIYWRLLNSVSVIEILGHRALWSFLFLVVWLALQGRLGEAGAALRDAQVRRSLLLSSTLLFLNWGIFVWAVGWGSVLQVSFGYFINPLMSIALGMGLLGERLNRAQSVAVGLAVLAVAYQAVALGEFPVVALWLAATFAAYGYCRKTVKVKAAPGLLVESLFQLPIALALLGWFEMRGEGHFLSAPHITALLMGTGPITAVPLVMFAAAAQRLRLATMGLIQYLVPSLQFLLAVVIFHEPLNPQRLLSFAIIWLALAVISIDALRREQAR